MTIRSLPASVAALIALALASAMLFSPTSSATTATSSPSATSTGFETVPATRAPVRAAAYSRVQRLSRANSLLTTSQATFQRVKNGTKTGIDTTFNWSDDGCSAPAGGAGWNSRFKDACERHDFGYRNLGWGWYEAKNLALNSTASAKDAIDSRFLSDMRATCGSNGSCLAAAQTFYAGVRKAGAAQTAFYKGECQPGYLCLFDDANYGDRRIRLTASEDDMNDVSFGDKTSSVKNTSSNAWRIYDDNGYRDRSVCVPRGKASSNLDEFSFGDKTSSAKRLTTTTGC